MSKSRIAWHICFKYTSIETYLSTRQRQFKIVSVKYNNIYKIILYNKNILTTAFAGKK